MMMRLAACCFACGKSSDEIDGNLSVCEDPDNPCSEVLLCPECEQLEIS